MFYVRKSFCLPVQLALMCSDILVRANELSGDDEQLTDSELIGQMTRAFLFYSL